MNKEITSAIQEGLRTAVLAVVALLLVQIEAGYIDWRSIVVAFIIGILRATERYLHKQGVTTGLEFTFLEDGTTTTRRKKA